MLYPRTDAEAGYPDPPVCPLCHQRCDTIKATGLPYTSQIRQTKQSKGWEKYKLSGIANEMAKKNGMKSQFLAKKDPEYKRVEQYRCSDIDFLSQLCHDAGLSLKCTDGKLVIFDQKEYEGKDSA